MGGFYATKGIAASGVVRYNKGRIQISKEVDGMEKTRILVLCDDLWHPAEVIERGLAALETERYAFDIVKTAKDILTPEYIARYPMILCCKSNCINLGNNAPWFEDGVTEVMPADFERYVRAGGGFLAVHSSLVYGENNRPEFSKMLGCAFVSHPPRCEVQVHVTQAVHPVAQGVEGFAERDEHYIIEMNAPDADVFLESTSEKGGRQTAGYTRMIGEGRLCVLTPGHTLSVWENPQFQKLLLNAMTWCMKEERA